MSNENDQPADRVLARVSADAKAIGIILATITALYAPFQSWLQTREASETKFYAAVQSETDYWYRTIEYLRDGTSKISANQEEAFLNLAMACHRSKKELLELKSIKVGYAFFQSTNEIHSEEQLKIAGIKSIISKEMYRIYEDHKNSTIVENSQFWQCMHQKEGNANAEVSELRERSSRNAGESLVPSGVTDRANKNTIQQFVDDKDKINIINSISSEEQIGNSPVSVTLSAGKKNGYDIDVFWCESSSLPESAYRLENAKKVANYFIESKQSQYPIGRVRLRKLFVEKQNGIEYPNSGRQIRFESNENEFANFIRNKLSSLDIESEFELYQIKPYRKTPYYISIFECFPLSFRISRANQAGSFKG